MNEYWLCNVAEDMKMLIVSEVQTWLLLILSLASLASHCLVGKTLMRSMTTKVSAHSCLSYLLSRNNSHAPSLLVEVFKHHCVRLCNALGKFLLYQEALIRSYGCRGPGAGHEYGGSIVSAQQHIRLGSEPLV